MNNNMPRGMSEPIRFSGNFLPSESEINGMPTPGYGLVNIADLNPAKSRQSIDSFADPLGALALVSPEAARELSERQQDIAEKRNRAAGSPLFKRGLM